MLYIQYIQQINARMVMTFLCEIPGNKKSYISLLKKRSTVHFTVSVN